MNDKGVDIHFADDAEIDEVRTLFREYAASLNFDLCFQNFEHELAALPGEYAPPQGRLLLATVEAKIAGCIGLRPLPDPASGQTAYCEMKRLYVRPQFRGLAVGRQLVKAIIQQAEQAGYRFMRLDTIRNQMAKAIALYRTFGFYEIASYRHNPLPDVLYLELKLAEPNSSKE